MISQSARPMKVHETQDDTDLGISDGHVRSHGSDCESLHESINMGNQTWQNMVVELKETNVWWIRR